MLKDRRPRDVIKYRIAMGVPGPPAPRELDYFAVTETTAPFDEVGLKATDPPADIALRQAITKTPRRLTIVVDSDNVEDWCRQEYRATRKNGDRLEVFCCGDGETAVRAGKKIPCRAAPPRDDGSGWKHRTPRDLAAALATPDADAPAAEDELRCPFAQNDSPKHGIVCKPRTELVVRLAQAMSGGTTFARFRSHGHRTADSIVQSVKRIKELTQGVLAGIPLALVLQRVRMTRPDGKSAVHSVAHLELAIEGEAVATRVLAVLQRKSQLAIGVARARALLAAPQDHADLEVEDAEFTPAPPSAAAPVAVPSAAPPSASFAPAPAEREPGGDDEADTEALFRGKRR